MLRISKNSYRVVRNINQSDDRFHLLLCTSTIWKGSYRTEKRELPLFVCTMWTVLVIVWVEGVHRYLRVRIYADIVRNCALYSWGFTVGRNHLCKVQTWHIWSLGVSLSRWLLFFKVMIISLWNLLQYHSIVSWAIQAQWDEPIVFVMAMAPCYSSF